MCETIISQLQKSCSIPTISHLPIRITQAASCYTDPFTFPCMIISDTVKKKKKNLCHHVLFSIHNQDVNEKSSEGKVVSIPSQQWHMVISIL